jgi:hypothetical protein
LIARGDDAAVERGQRGATGGEIGLRGLALYFGVQSISNAARGDAVDLLALLDLLLRDVAQHIEPRQLVVVARDRRGQRQLDDFRVRFAGLPVATSKP